MLQKREKSELRIVTTVDMRQGVARLPFMNKINIFESTDHMLCVYSVYNNIFFTYFSALCNLKDKKLCTTYHTNLCIIHIYFFLKFLLGRQTHGPHSSSKFGGFRQRK